MQVDRRGHILGTQDQRTGILTRTGERTIYSGRQAGPTFQNQVRTTFAHVTPPDLGSGMQTVRGTSPGRSNSLTKEAAQAGARSSSQHNARKHS